MINLGPVRKFVTERIQCTVHFNIPLKQHFSRFFELSIFSNFEPFYDKVLPPSKLNQQQNLEIYIKLINLQPVTKFVTERIQCTVHFNTPLKQPFLRFFECSNFEPIYDKVPPPSTLNQHQNLKIDTKLINLQPVTKFVTERIQCTVHFNIPFNQHFRGFF